jgi:hypothetical protein
LAHVQNTNNQYNLPEIGKKIAYRANRTGVTERFDDAAVQKTIEVDLALITYADALLKDLELYKVCLGSVSLSPIPLIGHALWLLHRRCWS